jgi:hypothetical protein
MQLSLDSRLRGNDTTGQPKIIALQRIGYSASAVSTNCAQ